ncbi:hypothetical protein [Hydrogenophaga sp.]|uniref:hypothetical protein n=1 Tax=Hydrogenophaga sp. TaxID=1904254 RepID=UPI0035B0D30A
MADSNVAERAGVYGYSDARNALQRTAQATGLLRVVSIAMEAQEDGSVAFDDNKFSRWGPAIRVACSHVSEVRDGLIHKDFAPSGVDWWTPLATLEAIDAAMWFTGAGGSGVEELTFDEVKAVMDAAIHVLTELHRDLSTVADDLRKDAAERATVGQKGGAA